MEARGHIQGLFTMHTNIEGTHHFHYKIPVVFLFSLKFTIILLLSYVVKLHHLQWAERS